MDQNNIQSELEKNLGVKFKNAKYLTTALTHRSFLNENKNLSISNNERLEFLGDAVLELVISEYLFQEFPDRPEGELTSFRAAIVKTESLAEASKSLNVGKYIFMSKGEDVNGGRERQYILANTFEAILGALYLDQGLKAVTKLIKKLLIPKIPKIVKERLDIDAKSKLQEISQEQLKYTPTYELVKHHGPDHARTFTMKVLIMDKVCGVGEGQSKQEAEQNAAQAALKNWSKFLKK